MARTEQKPLTNNLSNAERGNRNANINYAPIDRSQGGHRRRCDDGSDGSDENYSDGDYDCYLEDQDFNDEFEGNNDNNNTIGKQKSGRNRTDSNTESNSNPSRFGRRTKIFLLASIAIALLLLWNSRFFGPRKTGLRNHGGKSSSSSSSNHKAFGFAHGNSTDPQQARKNPTETLSAREQALIQKEKEIVEREKAATQHEQEIANKHKAAAAREKAVAEREKAAQEQQVAAEEREKAVAEREKATAQKEQEQTQHGEQHESGSSGDETTESKEGKEDITITSKEKETKDVGKEETADSSQGETAKESTQSEEIATNVEEDEEQALINNNGPISIEENPKQAKEQNLDKWEVEAWNRMSPVQREQVENFRKNNGLILNINIPHHGSNAMCMVLGAASGSVPSHICEHDREEVMPDPPDCRVGDSKSHTADDPPFCYSFTEMNGNQKPWLQNQTAPFIETIHPHFKMITWSIPYPVGREKFDRGRTLDSTDWENPNLVSAIVTRDPLARLLAGDGILLQKYPGYNTGEMSHSKWWDYAAYNDDRNTDNFFLRIVGTTHRHTRNATERAIPNHIEEGISRSTQEMMEIFPTGITQTQYEHAKKMLDRFTFVLDIECLTDSMDAMGRMLRMGQIPPQTIPAHPHTETPKERIAFDDVFEYLQVKNEWDIKLYEYSKTISIVRCPSKAGTDSGLLPEEAPSEMNELTEYPTLLVVDTEPPTDVTAPPTTHNQII